LFLSSLGVIWQRAINESALLYYSILIDHPDYLAGVQRPKPKVTDKNGHSRALFNWSGRWQQLEPSQLEHLPSRERSGRAHEVLFAPTKLNAIVIR